MNENEILAEGIERLNERVQKLENENEILRNNIEWLRLKLKKEDDKENTINDDIKEIKTNIHTIKEFMSEHFLFYYEEE